jgi:hypothetical protein
MKDKKLARLNRKKANKLRKKEEKTIDQDFLESFDPTKFFENFPTLKILRITDAKEKLENLTKISIFLSLSQNITILDFFGSKIGYKGIEYLAAGLTQNNSLRELTLGMNYIGDKGLECLVNALKGKPHFIKLCLVENGLTNQSVKYIADLLNETPSLSELNLRYSTINENGLEFLVPFIQKSNLVSFSLADGGGASYFFLEDRKLVCKSIIEVISINKTLTKFQIGYYFRDIELNKKIIDALSLNNYISVIFEEPAISLAGFGKKVNNEFMKDEIKSVCLENKKNVESIQKIIRKAIAYCSTHKTVLTKEELDILTNKDKDFVKAQLNAHPEWLEIEGRESIKVNELLHEIEQYTIGLQLVGENSV